MDASQIATKVREVQNIIGYTFEDHFILWEALQAPGSITRLFGRRNMPDGNKRLAILGDTIMKLVLIEEWYEGAEDRGKNQIPIHRPYSVLTERAGRASQIVSDVGSNVNLDRVGRLHRLDQHINRNAAQGQLISPVTMTATVEAILAAVYIDGGLSAVKQVMQTLGLGPS